MPDIKRSTVEKGNSFRDQTYALLRLRGWQPVKELLVAGKAADIVWERTEYGKKIITAVETKDVEQGLTRRLVTNIKADYLDAYQSHKIHQLWIVASKDIKGDHARSSVEESAWVWFFTFDEFRFHIMNFRDYLTAAKQEFDRSGLINYFIRPAGSAGTDCIQSGRIQLDLSQPKSKSFVDLAGSIFDWIGSAEDLRPLAIVGGYGLGKTTLAKFIFNNYCKEVLSGKTSRIPIYIELSRISSQQNIEGLLGALFTDEIAVDGYRFSLFREMNAAGNFVIIFDGFDEMKHLMTYEDFSYNFGQINRIVEGNSKVILLGRPSAFGSEAEFDWLLHGRRPVSGQIDTDSTRPDYHVFYIQPFDNEKVSQFLRAYLEFRELKRTGGELDHVDHEFITRRMEEIKDFNISDILQRPVQAKMLADLASQRSVILRKFSRYGLYREFVDRLIEREVLEKKDSRKAFSGSQRRVFLRELAWWLLKSGGSAAGVRLADIPDDLYARAMHQQGPVSASAKRDLTMGSLLDEKSRNIFVIPHRSFTEFLCAENLRILASTGTIEAAFLIDSAACITEVVLNFIEEGELEDKSTKFIEVITSIINQRDDIIPFTITRVIGGNQYLRRMLGNIPLNQIGPSGMVSLLFGCISIEQGIPKKEASIRGIYEIVNRVTSNNYMRKSTVLTMISMLLLVPTILNISARDAEYLWVQKVFAIVLATYTSSKFSYDDRDNTTEGVINSQRQSIILDEIKPFMRFSRGIISISSIDLVGALLRENAELFFDFESMNNILIDNFGYRIPIGSYIMLDEYSFTASGVKKYFSTIKSDLA